jgi:hypothetical protein
MNYSFNNLSGGNTMSNPIYVNSSGWVPQSSTYQINGVYFSIPNGYNNNISNNAELWTQYATSQGNYLSALNSSFVNAPSIFGVIFPPALLQTNAQSYNTIKPTLNTINSGVTAVENIPSDVATGVNDFTSAIDTALKNAEKSISSGLNTVNMDILLIIGVVLITLVYFISKSNNSISLTKAI